MIPVRTRASNTVYLGPTPDVGDAWCERRPGEKVVILTWKPTDAEREAIAGGALIDLGIYVEPIPPVSLGVSPHREIGAIAAGIRDQARTVLKGLGIPGPFQIPAGYWAVASDVWEDLQATEALDPNDGGVPKLLGRPLMEITGAEKGSIDYVIRPAATSPA